MRNKIILYFTTIGTIGHNRKSHNFTKSYIMTKKLHPFLDIIFRRKSVRSYTGKAVSKSDLELLIRAGMAAPSGRDERPWAFVTVTDSELIDLLTEKLPYAKMLALAGSGIVVCGYPVPHSRPNSRDLWEQDCAAATENILLAAEAMSLGAVWTALHPYPDRQQMVREILGIPPDVHPFCLIPVGYPAGSEIPKDKFDPGKVHWQKWRNSEMAK
jgi:nitroreductase